MYLYPLLKPLIYQFSPKQTHDATIQLLRLGGSNAIFRGILSAYFKSEFNGPAVDLFGLKFKNPIGMASGYDKDGFGWRGLATLGFSHIELGTVTPRPQPGNPEPRMFRLVEDEAIINRMGFPNKGSDFLQKRMQTKKPDDLVLGMNIGKNKDTPLESAVQDYLQLVKDFAPLADYLAVNISSPNTPELRKLQGSAYLESLLKSIQTERENQEKVLEKKIPLIVKLAPDMEHRELEEALNLLMDCGMDGVIISNTTISRPDDLLSTMKTETGGLSGKPLTEINTRLVEKTAVITKGKLPIIASGGIMKASDAQAKLDAGASLVQVYSGLIYFGPELVREILNSHLATNL